MSSSAVLHGLDLESEHCMFQNENGKVTLVPLGGAQCSVNGVQVTEPSQLNQGETTETCDVSSAVFTSLSENMFQPSEVKILSFHFVVQVLLSCSAGPTCFASTIQRRRPSCGRNER